MKDDDIEVLTLDDEEVKEVKKPKVEIIPVKPVEPVIEEKKEEKVPAPELPQEEKKQPKRDYQKLVIIILIAVIIIMVIFIIMVPLFTRWLDRKKTNDKINSSKYQVLVCSKSDKKEGYIITDAVKVYHIKSKAKKVDYITESNFYDKSDDYTKKLKECTELDSKSDEVLGYFTKCLVNDKKLTLDKEYDLEIFDNKSKANDKIKSVVLFDQNIKEIEEYYKDKNYTCE